MGRKIDFDKDVTIIEQNVECRMKDTVHYVHQMESVGAVDTVVTNDDDCVVVSTNDGMLVANTAHHYGLSVFPAWVMSDINEPINAQDSLTAGGSA